MQYPFVKYILKLKLKDKFYFLIHKNFRHLVESDIWIKDNFIYYNWKWFFWILRLDRKLLTILKKYKFDYAVGLMNYKYVSLITKFLLPAKDKIYFINNKLSQKELIWYIHETYRNYVISLFNDMVLPFELFHSFNIIKEKTFTFLEKKQRNVKYNKKIFIHVRYMNDSKRSLSFDKISTIIKFITKNYPSFGIILFSGEKENSIFYQLKRFFKSKKNINFFFSNNLVDISKILDSCFLCICPDSWIMHLAQYTKTNIIWLFAWIPPEFRLRGFKWKAISLYHYDNVNEIDVNDIKLAIKKVFI